MRELRKRYYIGLMPLDDFFFIGGVSMEEGKKHEFDKVADLSYGIYQAYADIVETKDGLKIERFGIENGNLKKVSDTSNNTTSYVKYKQDTDIFGFFDGETMRTKTEKSCNSCCDAEMKSLMNTLLNTQIETRVDGIDIPARVVDNTFFIVKERLDAESPVERTCVIETSPDGKVIKFECILMDNVDTDVVDAHDGYAECVNKTDDKKEYADDAVECIYASLTGKTYSASYNTELDDYHMSYTYNSVPEDFEECTYDEEIEVSGIDKIKLTRTGNKIKKLTIIFK